MTTGPNSRPTYMRLWPLLKVATTLGLLWLIYLQVQRQLVAQEVDLRHSLAQVHRMAEPLVLTVVLLMIANWTIEAQKWRQLLASHIELPLQVALKAILMGSALGIVTPANSGDYGGRLLVLPAPWYKHGLAATLLCSLCQNVCNVVGGLLCLWYYLTVHHVDQWWDGVDYHLIGVVVAMTVLMTIILLWVSTAIPKVKAWRHKALFYTKSIAQVWKETNTGLILYTLAWSSLRYLIYTTQYVLLVYAVGLNLDLLTVVSGVGIIYLLQTGIPLPPVMGVVARSQFALLIWTHAGAAAAPILLASAALWLINKVAVATIGALLISWSTRYRVDP